MFICMLERNFTRNINLQWFGSWKKVAEEYSSIFPGRYYIELQNHGIPEELQNIQLATKLVKRNEPSNYCNKRCALRKKSIIKHMMYISVLVPESIYQIKID